MNPFYDRKIITVNDCPPIPVRNLDWCAYRYGDEPDDHGNMVCGHGRTEAEAIEDLLDSEESHYAG